MIVTGRQTILFLFFLFFGINSYAESDYLFQETKNIPGKFNTFSVDNFGRIYLVEDDIVVQLSKEYDTIFTTSLKTFFPYSIESRKSFRSLLFDIDRSTIRFLDNTLTDIQGDIDLVQIGIQQPILACESFNGNTFWILDAANMRLVRLNDKLDFINQTENLIHLFDSENEPSQMLESNDFLYVLIPEKGVAVFDVFGTFIKLVEVNGSGISGFNRFLLVAKEKEIEVFDSQNMFMSSGAYPIPENTISFYFTQQLTYFLTESGISIGRFIEKEK